MGNFAPRGHARLDPSSPRAFAICDKCGFQYNHCDLKWEIQWTGTQINKTGFLVCPTCWDVPNPQLQARVLPADPIPILNPRKEPAAPPAEDVSQTVLTVATLPAAASVDDNSYRFVSDSTTGQNYGTYGVIVVGGGTFTTPVYSDGTNWRIA